jgi:hypothetical protein
LAAQAPATLGNAQASALTAARMHATTPANSGVISYKLAGDAIGDKGFIGTDYIITPVRKPKHRDLYMREQDYNNQISSLRAPVERAVANLKAWRMLFTD